MITSKRKPRKFSKCGSKKIASIVYGIPNPSLIEDKKDGKIVFGGCCVTAHDPAWKCIGCGVKIYKDILKSISN